MGGRDDEAVARYIEQLALVMSGTGFPRMPARVFASLLAADDGRRTAGDLAEVLRVSPAAISGATRYLQQVGLVGRERDPGSRRDHYVLSNDVWYEAIANKDEALGHWEKNLRAGAEVLGEGSPAGARFAESADFFAFLRAEMGPLMERWREHRERSRG